MIFSIVQERERVWGWNVIKMMNKCVQFSSHLSRNKSITEEMGWNGLVRTRHGDFTTQHNTQQNSTQFS